jgi:glycerol-3-phosphate dehydrogenase
MKTSSRFSIAAAGMALALAAGCATLPETPRPTRELQGAEAAIAAAERVGAAQYAAAELRIAREKFANARSAADRGEMMLAQRSAEQAQADAQLASARAQAAIERNNTEKIKGESP